MGRYLAYPAPPGHKPLKRGLYADQLSAWLKRFPRGQLLVLTSDQLYKAPQTAVDRVLAFLGVGQPSGFAFDFKAPRNAACKKDMAPYVDDGELAAMRVYYKEHNAALPGLVGDEATFPWLA